MSTIMPTGKRYLPMMTYIIYEDSRPVSQAGNPVFNQYVPSEWKTN